jgi:serine/threonine protein kinase/Tfp pilus assembly protein PilF
MPIMCPKCHSENPDTVKFCGECGTRLFKSPDISITETIPFSEDLLPMGSTFAKKYQIIKSLGRGGMGVVYQAKDTKLKRTVALKFLPHELTIEPEARERFIQEARAAAALDHQNICTVYEVDEFERQNYIAMAYIEGENLKKRLESGPMSVNEASNIINQVAEGLQEAHDKGIVHRDIKAGNIMFTGKGKAIIVDFGIAKLASHPGLTKAGSTFGTVGFMSPEQARGEDVDHRTDIWSLGVLFYEMLTGELPFQGENEAAVIYCLLNEEPKAIQIFRSDVPDYITRLISQILQKDRSNRISSAKEIITRLKEKTPKKAVADHKKSVAVLYFENMSSDKENEYFCAGMTEDLITDLSKIHQLRVIPRSDVLHFRNKEVNSRQVGEALGVQYILEGSVRKGGNKIRITAQLVDVKSGYHVWAERYDRLPEDVFEIQMEVSEKIADALKVSLTESEKQSLAQKPTYDLRAYDFYMRGNDFLTGKGQADNDNAIQMFEHALSIDPDFSLAYVGLAEAFSYNYALYSGDPMWLEKTMEMNEKALELDPNLVEAQLGLGMVHFHQKRYKECKESLEKVIQVKGDMYTAYFWLGITLEILGDYDGTIKCFETGVRIKPYSEEPWHWLDMINRRHGQENAAERATKKVIKLGEGKIEVNPEDAVTLSRMAISYANIGENEKALDAANKVMEIDPTDGVILYNCTCAYSCLGKKKEAFTCLKKALERGLVNMLDWIEQIDPYLESIRKDPEFQKILTEYSAKRK